MSTRRLSKQLNSSLTCNPAGVIFVGASYVFTNTMAATAGTITTMPAHQAGDLIVVFARVNGNSAVPATPSASGTVPAWTTIVSSVSGYGSNKTSYAIATASTTTTGIWTSANALMVAVFRRALSPFIANAAASATAFTSTSAPIIALSKTNGTSALVHFYGFGDGANTVTSINAAPQGYTQRINAISGNQGLVMLTKNTTDSVGYSVQTGTIAAYQGSCSFEVLAS